MLETNREKGRLVLIVAICVFIYYTIWVIGLPFIDDGRLHSFFPSHSVALLAPAITGLCFIGSLVLFTLYHLVRPW